MKKNFKIAILLIVLVVGLINMRSIKGTVNHVQNNTITLDSGKVILVENADMFRAGESILYSNNMIAINYHGIPLSRTLVLEDRDL